ncbi:MAG TPA: hypothetical protein DIC51_03940 [Coxiellaceae bacterium]|nr:hypothetical protein [Coxiellaceae bacterium]
MKTNYLISILSASTAALILFGCATTPPSPCSADCHGFTCLWQKPSVCPAQIDTSNSHLAALEKQGAQTVLLNERFILVIPSDAIFLPNSTELTSDAQKILIELGKFLQNYPDQKIAISAHTDPIGTDRQNKQLSTDQATVVFNYLWVQGLIPHPNNNRVTFAGEGSSRPIATNEKLAGMQKNRRIEIAIGEEKVKKPAVTCDKTCTDEDATIPVRSEKSPYQK